MIEARYHEEKLKLQQKHDAAVQKVNLHGMIIVCRENFFLMAVPDIVILFT